MRAAKSPPAGIAAVTGRNGGLGLGIGTHRSRKERPALHPHGEYGSVEVGCLGIEIFGLFCFGVVFSSYTIGKGIEVGPREIGTQSHRQ